MKNTIKKPPASAETKIKHQANKVLTNSSEKLINLGFGIRIPKSIQITLAVIISNCFCLSGFFLLGPVLTIRMNAAGFNQFFMGLQITIWTLAVVLLGRFYSPILLKFGAMKVLFASIIGCATVNLIYGLTPPSLLWILIGFLTGSFYGIFWVVSESWMNSVLTDKHRAKFLAGYAMTLGIGQSFAPMILRLVGNDGFMPILVAFALIIFGTIPFLFLLDSKPQVTLPPKFSLLRLIKGSGFIAIIGIIAGFSDSTIPAMFSVYLVKADTPWLLMLSALSAIAIGRLALQLPIGIAADYFDRRIVLSVIAVISVSIVIGLPYILGTVWQWPLLILWGGTFDAFYVIGLAIIGSSYSSAKLTEINLLIVMMHSLSVFIGTPLTGVMMDVFGKNGYAMMVTLMMGLAVVTCFFSVKRTAGQK